MAIKHKIKEYIIVFKEKLFELVPKIRQGSALSSELTKLFEDKEKSPFNKVQLQRLISHYAEEVNVLFSIQDLPHYCRDDGEFSAQLINNKQYMVGLVLQLGKHLFIFHKNFSLCFSVLHFKQKSSTPSLFSVSKENTTVKTSSKYDP